MKSSLRTISIVAGLALTTASLATASDLSSQYQWKPVRIGGGGYVVGMVLHPLDSTIRYARTDVGNAYRWDRATTQWIPMRVSNANGSGVQSASETDAPSGYGIESVAVDPVNTSVVYMVFATVHSCDIQCPTNFLEVYKSVDGGLNFTSGNMTASAILGNANGSHRSLGERLVVDPANPAVLYFASETQGLYRSTDEGATWTRFSGASTPPTNIEFLNIQFAKAPGTVTVNGIVVSKTIYAVSINNSDAGGDVYQSSDGGQTWTDISTGVTDTASGQNLSHQALASSIDGSDRLYVAENSATNGGLRAYWRFAAGAWNRFSLQSGINQAVVSVVADPTNAQRIYALGADTSLSRSDNGGANWINLGSAQYANTLAWLPQTIGMSGGEWHSNGGLGIDPSGNLWTPTGQEGPLNLAAAIASAATAANPPKWTIVTAGIEELVTQDIVVPPGSNDTIIAAAEDTTGFYIPNPDNFSAVQIPLQQEIISQGTSVDYAPDAPSYIAITSSNVATNGPNYSGYSTNGGQTWNRFGPALQYSCGAGWCDIPAGIVAVSVRGSRTLGSDHIVLYPPGGFAPQYSQDGGTTWHVTNSFPLNADGLTINPASYSSFIYPELHQHLLRADPLTADRFYLKFTHAPYLFYISTDGGQTWQGQAAANLPDYAWHGQLAMNSKVQNDLWYADGWEGSSPHGVFHSTDGGQTFQQLAGVSHAITIAVGAGSGQAGDAAYTVYFYGLLTSDPAWGIFRSTNGGSTWDRISYYPTGIYDHPDTMTASQDTFGKVYLGLSGDSFVYGELAPVPPPLPAAPTVLTATAVSNSQINLSWTAPSGTVTSYNIYRGIATGAEYSTPTATGVTGPTYSDASLTQGTTYYYKVAALNSTGQGPSSGEASATAIQPSITFAVAAGSSASETIAPGLTAFFQLQLTSTNYSGVITFTCTGAPAGDTCTVPSPISIVPSTSKTPVTISIETVNSSASITKKFFSGFFVLAGCLLILPITSQLKHKAWIASTVASFALLTAVSACGGGSGAGNSNPVSNPITSTLTVTATGAGVSQATQQLTLIVQ